MPYYNDLVIKVVVANREVWRVYVDNKAAVNILYQECFQKLGIDKSHLQPCAPLQTFAQSEVQLEEVVSLSITIGHDS